MTSGKKAVESLPSPFVTPPPLIQWDAIQRGGARAKFPSDSIAVGPGTGVDGRVVEVTNASVRIFDKTGTPVGAATALNVMFPPAAGSEVFDPKILYDQHSTRFYIVVIERRVAGLICYSAIVSSRIRLAVSTTPVPSNLTTDWIFLAEAAPPLISFPDPPNAPVPTFSDSPAMGADSDSLFVTTTQLDAACALRGSNIRVFNKAALAGGAYTKCDATLPGAPPIQPAHVFGATDNGAFYLIGRLNDAAYRLYKIVGDPALCVPTSEDRPWTAGLDPVSVAKQCVVSPDIESMDTDATRLTSAVCRGGSLWTVQTSDFDLDPETEVVWHEIQTNGGVGSSVVGFGAIPENGGSPWRYNPSINVDGAGNVLINYSQSAPGECPSIYAALHQVNDTPGNVQDPVLVKAAGFFDSDFSNAQGEPEPWGHYSAVAIDPVDECFWLVNEYAATSVANLSLWGTHIAKLCGSLEGACCFEGPGWQACSIREQGPCTALGGNFRGIGSKCPTQNVHSAMHASGPVVHWVDPAIRCSAIFPLVAPSTCCVAHPTPGCDTPSCQSQVCAADSYCCNFDWDPSCAQEAQSLCGGLCSQGCDPSYAIDPWVTPAPGVLNTTPISIPGSGAATPYPSTISVSGMTGGLTSITLTLGDIRHTYPDDIDIMLVGPGGQNLIVMSDAGGNTAAQGVSLTLSDAAPSFLPDAGPLVSGTFRPSNYVNGSDTFPAPAPAPSGASSFGVFNGTNPNGTWRLYVVDGFALDSGSIGSWSLNLTTSGGGSAGHSTCDSSFNSQPLPAGFFTPDSQPFGATICYQGQPLGPTGYGDFGSADTLVKRYGDPFDRCEAPSARLSSVPIELVALNLVSVQPIQVQGLSQTTYWDVQVGLSTVPAPPGSLSARKTHCGGGTWSSTLPVQPRFTFTRIDDHSQVRVLDTGQQGYPPVVLQLDNSVHPWSVDLEADLHIPGAECSNTHPSVEASNQSTSCDCNHNGQMDACDIAAGHSVDCNQNGVPDECDPDTDGDGRVNGCDNCPGVANPGQQNADGDRYGDACDLCPVLAERLDGDPDGDRELEDAETVLPPGDNCPCVPNPDQADSDGDGIGNVCDCAPNDPTNARPGETGSLAFSSKTAFSWPATALATSYDVVRGNIAGLPVGPGAGDELCFGNLALPSANDVTNPTAGFFYVVRAKNACGAATSYGLGHTNPGPPLNGPPRNTTTCP